MALQVWLPLNGDLHNQGLSNITTTNNSSTVDNAGKIGKCYKFSPSQTIVNQLSTSTTSTIGSLSCWVKFNAFPASGSFVCLMKLGNVGSGYDSCLLSYWFHSNGTCGAVVKGNVLTQRSNPFSTNTWYHLALTSDGTTIKTYINGNETYSESIGSGTHSTANYLLVGGAYASGANYGLNGYMNDCRYYDHCLSEIEVKELAKGLVLHYPLNDKNCEGTTNLASTTTGGWNNSGDCIRLYNDTSLDSSKPTPGAVPSVKITTAGNCALTCGYTSVNLPSKTLTFSIWCYLSGPQEGNAIYIRSNKTDGNVGNFEYNGSASPTTWPINKWIRLEKTITTASDATTFYFCTYVNVLDRYVALNGWQIEEKDHATPWTAPGTTRAASTTEYDISGFCNNGSRIGSFNWTSDTPKYGASIYFPNTTSTNTFSDKCWISGPCALTTPNQLTVAFWFKKETITRGGLFTTNTYNSTATDLTVDDYDNSVKVRASDGSSVTLGSYDSLIPVSTWCHWVMTFDGTNVKIYINGVLKNTVSYNGIKTLKSFTNITLGANAAGGVYRTAKGSYSDFRIYATALSADDVKSLYQNEAYIDSSGNIYGKIR